MKVLISFLGISSFELDAQKLELKNVSESNNTY